MPGKRKNGQGKYLASKSGFFAAFIINQLSMLNIFSQRDSKPATS